MNTLTSIEQAWVENMNNRHYSKAMDSVQRGAFTDEQMLQLQQAIDEEMMRRSDSRSRISKLKQLFK